MRKSYACQISMIVINTHDPDDHDHANFKRPPKFRMFGSNLLSFQRETCILLANRNLYNDECVQNTSDLGGMHASFSA